MKEKACLITVRFDSLPYKSYAEDTAHELKELALSAGLAVILEIDVRQKQPNAALWIGRGKAQEIKEALKKNSCQVAVFDSDLTTTQQRNLEDALDCKTIDRTQLILDIFAARARSMEGKLQVELAQLKYLLPRLSGKGIALSRLGGGVGTRGPGEQKLEMDRRRIRERIARLARELLQLGARRKTAMQSKRERGLPVIALIGYTNAGKSTLFNKLSRAEVLAKNQMFSTLDTTTRALQLPRGEKALLVDTVGFVRDLPHHLIEAFKATLEEAMGADILLHVLDASRPDKDFLQASVNGVLESLGVDLKKPILVSNKSDLVPASKREGLAVSALTGEGIDKLLALLSKMLGTAWFEREVFIPKEELGKAHLLYERGEVLKREDLAHGSRFHVRMPADLEWELQKKR